MFSCAYSSFTCSFIYNICSIYPLTTVKTPSRNDMECCCHFHIESDTAPRHSVPGIQWKNVRSSCFFQHIQRVPANSQPLSPWDGVEKCWKQSLLPMYSNGPRGPLFSSFTELA